MKRISILVFLVILALPLCAYAYEYTDTHNLMQVEIPEEENTYYSTPEDNNLFADLSEKLAKDNRDIRFFVASYTPSDELIYSIAATAVPFQAKNAEEAEGALSLTDITTLSAEDKQSVIATATEPLENVYTFSQPETAELGGVPALKVTGTAESAYQCDVYVTSNTYNIVVTEVQYNPTVETPGKTTVEDQLNAISFGLAPETLSTEPQQVTLATAEPVEIPTTESQPTAIGTVSPASTSGSGSNFFTQIGETLAFSYQNDPNFVLYTAISLAVLAVVIFLILFARYKYAQSHHKDTPEEEPADAATTVVDTLVESDIIAPPELPQPVMEQLSPVDETLPDEPNEPLQESTAPKEDIEVRELEKEFKEDISRYTQQPGREVNDISRNTLGGYNPVDADMQNLTPPPAAATPRSKQDWKTTGSRVDRYKKKRKK